MPKFTKVINKGWDGTGIHCQEKSKANKYLFQTLDSDAYFEFLGNDWSFFKDNCKTCVKENVNRWGCAKFLITILKDIISRLYA